MGPMLPRTGLWAHADFMRLWSAQAISAFGSRITRTALPIIAVQSLNESETIVALLSSVYLAPGVVLALFAGGAIDRSLKRRILIGADIFRAATVASITIAWLFGALAMWHLIVVGALVGAASALFSITDNAYLPTLLPKRDLAEGNAKLESTEAIAEVTGPASAGVLIGALGAPVAVALDALSYLWSAARLGRIRATEAPLVRSHNTSNASSSMWQSRRDLRDGMRAVFGHPHVRAVVLALMVWSIAGGFFTALYTLFCLRTLHLSEVTFGIIIAVGGVGSLGGALISRRLVASIGLGRTLILSAVISLAGGLLIPLANGSPVTVLFFLAAHQLISDCFSVAFVIQAVTLRQTVLPKHLLGRANAAVHVCTAGLVPVTALLAGVLAEVTSIRTAVWVGVTIGLLAPIFLIPLRRVRAMPESASSTQMAVASGG